MSNKNSQNREITNIVEETSDHRDRERHIAVAAYYKAERRGFETGHELDDWVKAEAEIDGAGE